MTDFKIEINAEAIQQQVTQAILDSAIGQALKKQLEQLASTWNVNGYWDNTLRKIIENQAHDAIRNAVLLKIGPVIKDNVDKLLTDEFLQEAASAALARITFSKY